MALQVRVITNITKVYPEMIKVTVFKKPQYYVAEEGRVKRSKYQVGDDYTPQSTSISRTKTLIRDIVLCNDFELFCTFTFDPKKVDSFRFFSCWRVMSTWLHHQSNNSRERGKEFKYLIIPEQHKSGRWHFHALISGYTSTLKDTKLKTTSLRPIYNVTSFRSGFTTAVPIDSKQIVSQYITKYITKDMIKTFNQRRFFCSRNLVRPVKITNSPLLASSLPLFRRKLKDYPDREVFALFKDNFSLGE